MNREKRAEKARFLLAWLKAICYNQITYVNCSTLGDVKMKAEKIKFYVERGSFGIQAMTILMALSVIFRIIGCWGLWNDRNYALFQIALPILSAILLILCVQLLGKHALWLSFIPVLFGAVFFIIKSLGFDSRLHTVLCILLYMAVIVLYFCTVFGILRTKWLLVLLFGLPFLYHVFIEDLNALRDTANPVSFAAGMQEMGVLCIMLGLFFLSLSMKKSETEQGAVLPKMRAPKVLPNQKPKTEESGNQDQNVQVEEKASGIETEPVQSLSLGENTEENQGSSNESK